MVTCPNCGPVITVSRRTRDGDIGFCRVCGTRHRLHRSGDTFDVEPIGEKATADDLQPRPEWAAIQAIISLAPASVEI